MVTMLVLLQNFIKGRSVPFVYLLFPIYKLNNMYSILNHVTFPSYYIFPKLRSVHEWHKKYLTLPGDIFFLVPFSITRLGDIGFVGVYMQHN